MGYVIAIDGPAGAGKSTVARYLAKKLGFLYLDTGALYRTVTYKALKQKADLTNEAILKKIVETTRMELKNTRNGLRVFMDGEDVTKEIRKPKVSNNTFYIACSPKVREALLPLQRSFAEKSNLVAEGRDTTTVVFPDATLKIYLDADPFVRAVRRKKDLERKLHLKTSLERTLQEVTERDRYDLSRSIAPLRQAPEAIYLDTTNLTISQVVDRLISLFKASVSHASFSEGGVGLPVLPQGEKTPGASPEQSAG